MIGLLVNVPNKDRETFRLSLYSNICSSYDMELMIYMHGGAWSEGHLGHAYMCMEIEDAQRQYPDHEWVIMLPKREAGPVIETVMLADFEHPKNNVVYVIGPNYDALDMDRYHADHVVTIPTKLPHGNLHSHTAAAIVAYDRWRRIET